MPIPSPAELRQYPRREAWKDQFPGRGWAALVFYLTEGRRGRIHEGIIEEGVDLCALSEFGPWGNCGPLPTSQQASAIAEYVSKSMLRPIFGRPFPSIFSALEGSQFLDSKAFLRDSGWLPTGIDAIGKAFGTLEEAPRALYALLYQSLVPEEAGSEAQLQHDLQVVRAACQLLLDVAPHFRRAKPTRASMLAWHNQYLGATGCDQLSDAETVVLYDEEQAARSELNATLLAFVSVLRTGHTYFVPSAPAMIPVWAQHVDKDSEFQATLSLCLERNRLPERLRDFPIPSADATPINMDRLPKGIAAWRLLKTADQIVLAARKQPFAWLSRTIEDRFLNMTPTRNVRITYTPDARDTEGHLTVSRHTLHSVADPGEFLPHYPPHLFFFELHYPKTWDVSLNSEHRFKLFRWFALIDLVERQQLAQREDRDIEGLRTLDNYKADLPACETYALALATMTGSIGQDQYTLPQAMAMLEGAVVSWAELMAMREWRDAILPRIDYRDHAWPRLRAETTPSGERAWLLSELVGELPAQAEELSLFVLEQLSDDVLDDQHPDFLEMLIYAVQELDFFDENQRKVALAGVWRITEILATTQDMPKPVGLWAGIRVFASLATEAETPRLAKFLGVEYHRETQQAALRAVYRYAFALAPPRASKTVEAFQGPLLRLVETYLREDLVSERDTGLMARELVRTQAALGLPDTLVSLEKVSEMNRSQFAKQVAHELAEQLSSFDSDRSLWTASTCRVCDDIRQRLELLDRG